MHQSAFNAAAITCIVRYSYGRFVCDGGGTARIDPDRVQMLKNEGLGPAAIAGSLGISRMSVYRALKSDGIAK